MNFLLESWAVIASSVMSWLKTLDNNILDAIVNLLTIFVISLGLLDWLARKRKTKKQKKVLKMLEGTQKPFKAVDVLNNPVQQGEQLGTIIEQTAKFIGGRKMKKFIKWIWYNKEQLLSILYSVAVIAATNFLMWSDVLNGFFDSFTRPESVIIVKVVALVLSLGFTALTVRNVCVKYGLSSLETIDNELAKRAEEKEKQLTAEQKKALKSNIAILQSALENAKTELKNAEAGLEKITALYNADNTLVSDFVVKRQNYEKKITTSKTIVTNIEEKIAGYKATLNGNTEDKK